MNYTQANADRILEQLSKPQPLPKTILSLLAMNDMHILAEEVKRLRAELEALQDAHDALRDVYNTSMGS